MRKENINITVRELNKPMESEFKSALNLLYGQK